METAITAKRLNLQVVVADDKAAEAVILAIEKLLDSMHVIEYSVFNTEDVTRDTGVSDPND